jgi:hypothetical protein
MTTRIKVPVVVAEPTIQIPIEAIITLAPAASEIKRVKKNVFLEQVKLVPVAPFSRIDGTDFFTAGRAKLFVAGHIRENIEFAARKNVEFAAAGACAAPLQDQIVDIPFSGVTDVTSFINPPVIGINEASESSFLSDMNPLNARLDKFFFNNLVKFNEQPFGELVSANFFELDFSSTEPVAEGTFRTLTEKIVMELTLKVLQNQQLQFLPCQPMIQMTTTQVDENPCLFNTTGTVTCSGQLVSSPVSITFTVFINGIQVSQTFTFPKGSFRVGIRFFAVTVGTATITATTTVNGVTISTSNTFSVNCIGAGIASSEKAASAEFFVP